MRNIEKADGLRTFMIKKKVRVFCVFSCYLFTVVSNANVITGRHN